MVLTLISFFHAASIGFTQNPIVTENALTGNPPSEWDISGIGDPDIQGFATDLSINTGGTVDFKIDVKAPATNFSIKIYRIGYYGGNGARLVADLGDAFVGVQQPSPLYETATGKTDCSNWSVSASWTATAAVSGIYLARISRNDDGGASHIAFVVRDDSRNAPMLFKTSDATWQAYNGYGGNSLYVNNSGTPVPGFNHATKVSYDRPFYTRGGGGGSGSSEDWLFNAEYPMIRWLERNGYDLSYTTDVDMDRDPTPITPSIHQVLLSVGHDEYWSLAERAKFETARNNGVHLAFFSGNEVYWKTRWEDNHRTLVCYKEGTLGENICGGDCDPDPNVWTGLWRDGCSSTDSNDGCNPENALTAQISWGDATGSISVPDDFSGHRFWRNTSITSLANGQTATLPNGTLGYEFDFEQYFDFYPPGRVTLSNTILAGKNHKLALYRHSSGALVFGAGTVQWSWGLDANHDRGNEPESIDMQQATVNLFADMGVLPATLMPGLVSAAPSSDVTAPVTVIATPADGATVAVNASVSISGTASEVDGVVAGVEVSTDGGTTWQVATGTTNWTYNWTPTAEGPATIQARAFDDLGNMEVPVSGQPNYIPVTVGPAGPVVCPCSIWPSGAMPLVANEADNQAVELGVKFQSNVAGFITGIRFYKGPLNTGIHSGSLWAANGTLLETAVFTGETASGWQEVLFTNPVAIDANTTYVASYFAPNGQYSVDVNYFASGGVFNNPLTALAEGVDGSNGVYSYNPISAFPDQTFNSSNYWVDVVFETSVGPDVTPPTVQSTAPADNAVGIAIGITPSAVFSEGIDPVTLTAATFTMESGGNPVAGTVGYNQAAKTATFTPGAALAYNTTYTLTLVGGASGITDLAANPLAADYSWTFTTGGPPPPPPTDGPGGPILLISSTTNGFSRYPVEILRAQGFNEFTAEDVSQVNAGMMADYDVIILGEFALSAGLVTDLTNWVDGGGTLIAFRPDAQLNALLGISAAAGSLSEGYLLVNTASGPGTGIVNQTIQFHGTADYYTLNGATALASLYSDATTATVYPAVTINEVGANNGKAIAFTYDLARSVVYTRQGNPAWAGQNRDVNATPSDAVIRANDLFYGDAPGDSQPDWVDLNKAQIPQADEQLHLLSNIILQSSLHRQPLPRFWFLPNNFKAAVVMTGDDHASTFTDDFFDAFIALSPDNSQQAVDDWEAVRSSSYLYTNTPLPVADALTYQSQGFEVGIHINTGCNVWTPASLASDYSTQLADFATLFPGIDVPTTHRTHCIAWSDYDTQPQEMVANGMRLDVNYYYWPESWVQDRPGLFTGSGIPMRFATEDGALIDCYQVPTQMTDESGQNIALHITTLLDNAVGANAYYGVFCANMHTDRQSSIALATQIVAAAQARNVPVVSSRQMLSWLDGRNASSFDNLSWNGNELGFEVAVGTGADNLYGMVPLASLTGQLLSIELGGSPVSYQAETSKGMDYALFPAVPGSYVAIYGSDARAPEITDLEISPDLDGTATVTWETDEPADSEVDYGLTGGALNLTASDGALVMSHSMVLSGLTLGQTYDLRVRSTDGAGNTEEFPVPPAVVSFTMPRPPCGEDTDAPDFAQGTTDANTLIVLEDGGGVMLAPTLNEEFNGVGLPVGWNDAVWDGQAGALTTFDGSQVTVDGTHLNTLATFSPGTAIECLATFSAGNFQNIGFTADAAFNSPWAVIGRGSAGDNNVYARTSDGQSVLLGTDLLNTPHKYRITWNAGTNDFSFFVDDVLIPTPGIVLTVASPATMLAQISDYPAGGQNLSVDWLRVGAYPAAGTFTSRIFDQGTPDGWGQVDWNAIVPAGTGLAVSARLGNTPTPDGSWTTYTPLVNGSPLGLTSQYLQYKVDLSTANPSLSPLLEDITFECGAGADVTAPVITNIVAIPAPDGLSATISWDTDEPANSRVDFGTIATTLDQNTSSATLVSSHSLQLNGLTPGTTYYFRVTSADLAANSATEPILVQPALSFITSIPACFTDETLADFVQGTTLNTYLDVDEDGVILAPTAGSEFTVLPPVAEWQSFAWNAGGTSTVSGGALTVDGARFNSDIGTPFNAGVSLEFRAVFGAANFQHIGFGGGNDDVGTGGIYTGQNAWAMFSTGSTGVLQARTSLNGSSSADVIIPGSFTGAPHLYRIDWNPNSVEYYIDGNLVHTETITLPNGMRPAISDFNLAAPGISVDWIRLTPYLSPGSFESRVYDAGVPKDWGAISWVADVPAGTSLAISVRTGSQLPLTGPYAPVTSSGDQVGTIGRYIQYKADLTTSDGSLSPVLREVAVACEDAPTTSPVVTLNPVSQVICEGLQVTFESSATGNPAPDIQWQVSTDNGSNWSDILSETNPVYSFTAALTDAGNQYRAVWTNTAGSVNSNAASLGVNPQPTADLIALSDPVCVGDPVELQLSNTIGASPFSVVMDGTTYASVLDGQTFADPNPALSTIWAPTATGGSQAVDNVDTELGLQFSSSVDGVIKGIRFYKTGTDILTFSVSLWELGNTTTPLATANYTSDAVPGWKQVDFVSPVAIDAGTSYLASYFSPNPNYYAFTANGLAAPVVNPPLTAEASSFQQPGPGYPATASTANYWVDVVFLQNDAWAPITYELTSIADANGCIATGSPLSSVTVSSNPRPSGSLSADATDVCGGDQVNLTYTAAAGTGPYDLVINGTPYTDVSNGVPFAAGFAAEPTLTAPVYIWNNTTPTPTSTQDSELVLGTKFRSSEAGVISGIKFFKGWNTAGTETYIVRLWTNGGTGNPGVILAEASVTLDDANTGWQQINFAQPVAIAANTTYVASLYSPSGYYSFNGNYFPGTAGYNESGSPLTALGTSDTEGPNGVYAYTSNLDFPYPSSSINATNYWVDVAFQTFTAASAYQLTQIDDAVGCTTTGTPVDELVLEVHPCPCDLATTGLVLRLESDYGVELAPSGVSTWKDLSGEENDLTAVGNPLLTAAGGPNGHAFIQLDGVAQKLERTASLSGLPTGNDDRTVFLIARYNSAPTAAAGFVYGNTGTDQAFGLTVDNTSGNLAVTSGTTAFVSSGTSPDGAGAGWLSHSAVLSDGTLTHYKNGDAIGSAGHTFATVLNKIVIGEDMAGTAFAAMDVAAVLVYDRALSTAEREEIEGYLQYKYLGLLTDGLVLHLESDLGISETGGTVTAWADQSGQGNDLAAAGDPQWITVNGPNGQAYLELDGVGDKLERMTAVQGLPTAANDRTIFLVAAYETAPNPGAPGLVYGTDNNGEAFGLVVDGSTGNLAASAGGTSLYPTTVAAIDAGWLIQSAVLESGQLDQYKNGALLQTDNPTLNTIQNAILLGEDLARMNVAAVLVYDRALSEAERRQVEVYLQHKYFGIGNACVQVTAKAMLQGPFNISNGLMNDDLRLNSLIPPVDPYSALNFTHLGGGYEAISPEVLATSGNDAIVDWVFLELRDAGDPTTVIATRSALIQRDGDIVDVNGVSPVRFANVAPGDYYVAVFHRNHLAIMSGGAVRLYR